jgi:hypothetical protein
MTAQQAMQHPWIRMKEVHVGTKQENLLPGLEEPMSHRRVRVS